MWKESTRSEPQFKWNYDPGSVNFWQKKQQETVYVYMHAELWYLKSFHT